MNTQTYYYSADGLPIILEPATDTLAIVYKDTAPAKDLEKLIRGDDQLAKLITSRELTERNLVLYKRSPTARTSLDAFVSRIQQSDLIAYTCPLYFRGQTPVIVSDEFIVAFKPEVQATAIAIMNAESNVEIVQEVDFAPSTFLLRVMTPNQQSTLTTANRYFESGQVEYAEPNFIYVPAPKFVTNDPLFGNQWHLPRIQTEPAWDITRGVPDVVIAVVDDGLDLDHEDFASPGKIVPGIDLVGGDANPRPGLGDAHGTAAAGVATADGNNGIGVSGLAPRCRLMGIRLLGTGMSNLTESQAFRFASDNGASIISNSWGPTDGGGPGPLPGIVRAAIDYAANNGRGGLGCVILFAAGNGNEHISAPATLDGYASYHRVIAVAAVNDQNVRSGYSDFGPEVNICAPSDGTSAQPAIWRGFPPDSSTLAIFTTDRMGAAGYNPPSSGTDPAGAALNYTGTFGGTSSACPLAAGLAALVLSIAPDLTEQQVRYILEATADKVDEANADPVGRYQASGHSQWYGYGRVNALNAVRGARSSVSDSDEIQSITVTLRRIGGDRFVSDKVIQAIDARQRRAGTAAQDFIRGGSDGFLRAEFGSRFDEIEVDS
ncbi:Calcium-dependent protease precursor [hydrothermal vent metagenome]|uniref:Calcium-dependent protease n=1 Tax=hydrothermal vent metagenome TaxID=652676 RepID=A0A3B0UMB0_9ZZZZ